MSNPSPFEDHAQASPVVLDSKVALITGVYTHPATHSPSPHTCPPTSSPSPSLSIARRFNRYLYSVVSSFIIISPQLVSPWLDRGAVRREMSKLDRSAACSQPPASRVPTSLIAPFAQIDISTPPYSWLDSVISAFSALKRMYLVTLEPLTLCSFAVQGSPGRMVPTWQST